MLANLLKSLLPPWARPWLIGIGLLRLAFWGWVFPNPDEAYYWLWGQHPGWSYYDHPPFQAWVQGLFAGLLGFIPGTSTWALRLPNLLSSLLLILVFGRICRYLYRDRAPDLLGGVILLLAASPLFFLFTAMAWPDHWLIAFVVISGYSLVRFLDDYAKTGQGDGVWLYGAALALGMAGLCKYTALLVGAGGLATIASQPRLRPLLRDRRLYGAAGLSLLVLSPVLLWNLQNSFFSFRYYLERSAGSEGISFQPLQPLVFLLLSGLILGPFHSWGLVQLGRARSPQDTTNASSSHHSTYWLLAWWVFGLSTGSFMLLSLVSTALYYWNILAYPLLLPLLARELFMTPSGLQRPRPALMALGLAVAAGLMVNYWVIPLAALGGNSQADPDSAALYGWPEIAAAVQFHGADLSDPLRITTDYRSASALAYALKDAHVWALSGRLDQFDFWYDAEALRDRDAVLLGEQWHPICPAHLAMFRRSDSPQTLTIRRLGRPLQTYTLIKAYGFNPGPDSDYPLQPNYPLAASSDGERCF